MTPLVPTDMEVSILPSCLSGPANSAILAHFQDFVRKLEKPPNDVTDDQLEEACFPPPKACDSGRSKWKPLSRNLKYFMGFVVRFGVPPGIHDAAVSDSCLAQYREVLMFWVSRSYRLRDMDGPRSHEVSNEMTEVVQHLEAKHGITRRSQSIAEKSYVDIEELRQMVDEGTETVDGKNIIGRQDLGVLGTQGEFAAMELAGSRLSIETDMVK
ncbi:hypothetical protein K4K52_010297 [Colletotrichum sp. SAR 10_76]|nr:hypothetical protein K4K52_010297 [Colletotrichum sp. SAR 10_76]